MKNINELSRGALSFVNSLPYGEVVNKPSGNLYIKFTGYHGNGKTVDEMVPEGYKAIGLMQLWSEIKRTSINIISLEEL